MYNDGSLELNYKGKHPENIFEGETIYSYKNWASKTEVNRFIAFVCNEMKVSLNEVLGKARPKYLTNPRRIICYILRFWFALDTEKMASYMRKNHTTVTFHACNINAIPNGLELAREMVNKFYGKEKGITKDFAINQYNKQNIYFSYKPVGNEKSVRYA